MATTLNRFSAIYVKKLSALGYHPDGDGLYLSISKSDLADTDMMNFIDEALIDVDGWHACVVVNV